MRRPNLRLYTLAARAIWCVLLLAVSANGANLTVKSGGGGNYTTIQACATAMSPGDTCTVYAGTYNENVTVPAGTAGNYKTISVNGSDVVSVYKFTLNSHTKLVGNCPTPTPGNVPAIGSCGFTVVQSSPSAGTCVSIPDGSTDIYIKNNVMSECGGSSGIIYAVGSNGISYVYIQGNTLSYGCGTPASPNNCVAIGFNGNHILVENNDMSHFGLAIETYAQFAVIRNNTFHDMNESECGPASGNCHLDIIYAERSNAVASDLVLYQLWEGNTGNTITGPDGKGLWTAADDPGGCGTSCFNIIGRYNLLAHFGSGAMAQTSGFLNVKYYNNSVIDGLASFHGSNGTVGGYQDGTSTGGADINNLYYFPFSVAQSWGWAPYSLNSSTNDTGFTAGANLAYCSVTPCSLLGRHGAVNGFATDAPVIASNIVASSDPLMNYSAGDFHLAAGSPAVNRGTYLTTVAAGDSGSGTSLVVTDAGFFQDGLGLNAAGVQADCIAVGTASNHVCITAVNYTANTLTLVSSISRSAGQGVYLYSRSDGTRVLTGSAPDMGAYPYTGIAAGAPAAPSNLSAVVQ